MDEKLKMKLIGIGLIIWIVLYFIPLKIIDFKDETDIIFLMTCIIWAISLLYGVIFHWWIVKMNMINKKKG